MGTTIKTISTDFVADKQSPTLHSLEDTEAQSEVSVHNAGASRKTDPAEIALVRKTDLCMMQLRTTQERSATIVYKRKEIATRISILFSTKILATAFQGLIAAPIYSELSGKQLAADRIAADTVEKTLVLTCPPYILAGISSVLAGLSSGRLNERTWHITVIKLIFILGFVLACATLKTGTRYFGAFVFVAATYPVNSLNLSWTGITCGQTSEKRAASLAAVNTLSSISLIWTPVNWWVFNMIERYLWPDSAAPQYILPMAASAGMCFATIALSCMWYMRWDLMRENKRIRRSDNEAKIFYAY
ncbi:hypothetical protein diail_4297 [Diaporthe ilicicola]|nr:hypothetical protein diail_4297 [Diaporthe ilicicola]